jgi:hypothetical protein
MYIYEKLNQSKILQGYLSRPRNKKKEKRLGENKITS